MSRCLSLETQKVIKPETISKPLPELQNDIKQLKVHYGQPTHQTHPHLLKEGELIPGIPHSEFVERRQKLAELIRVYSSKLDARLQNHLVRVIDI